MKKYGRSEVYRDGKLVETTYLYTLEEYRELLHQQLKELWRTRIESIVPPHKQVNSALGILPAEETAFNKQTIENLLLEYNSRKEIIYSSEDPEVLENTIKV